MAPEDQVSIDDISLQMSFKCVVVICMKWLGTSTVFRNLATMKHTPYIIRHHNIPVTHNKWLWIPGTVAVYMDYMDITGQPAVMLYH